MNSKYTNSCRSQSPEELVRRWLFKPELFSLVEAFGGSNIEGESIQADLQHLAAFSECWDFRKGGERIAITPSEFSQSQLALIDQAARALHLKGAVQPEAEFYDAIVVLGGTLLACYLRTKAVADVISSGVSTKAIYLLGTARAPASGEKSILTEFGLTEYIDASNEFEMLCMVAKRKLGVHSFAESVTSKSSEGYESIERRFVTSPQEPAVSVLCTAGRQNPHRATTGDTYEHLLEAAEFGADASVLIVTTQIYVPFQHFDAVRLIQEKKNIRVETIGFSTEDVSGTLPMHNPENYLQEIRSAILAGSRLIERN